MFETNGVLAANPIVHRGLGALLGVPGPAQAPKPARRVLTVPKASAKEES